MLVHASIQDWKEKAEARAQKLAETRVQLDQLTDRLSDIKSHSRSLEVHAPVASTTADQRRIDVLEQEK